MHWDIDKIFTMFWFFLNLSFLVHTGLKNNSSHYYKNGMTHCHESKQEWSIAFIPCKQREAIKMQWRSPAPDPSVAVAPGDAAKADCNAADFSSM